MGASSNGTLNKRGGVAGREGGRSFIQRHVWNCLMVMFILCLVGLNIKMYLQATSSHKSMSPASISKSTSSNNDSPSSKNTSVTFSNVFPSSKNTPLSFNNNNNSPSSQNTSLSFNNNNNNNNNHSRPSSKNTSPSFNNNNSPSSKNTSLSFNNNNNNNNNSRPSSKNTFLSFNNNNSNNNNNNNSRPSSKNTFLSFNNNNKNINNNNNNNNSPSSKNTPLSFNNNNNNSRPPSKNTPLSFNKDSPVPSYCPSCPSSSSFKTSYSAWTSLDRLERHIRNGLCPPLLTLFGTWKASADLDLQRVQNITLRNWALLRPFVRPVLFLTSDSSGPNSGSNGGPNTGPQGSSSGPNTGPQGSNSGPQGSNSDPNTGPNTGPQGSNTDPNTGPNTGPQGSNTDPNTGLQDSSSASRLAEQARAEGWDVLPVSRSAIGGLPVLKNMFLDAMKSFTSTLFAYANGDILFSPTLLHSLLAILADRSLPLERGSLFAMGQRTNVNNVTEEQARGDLDRLAAARGKKFMIHAQDFFVTDRRFAWDQVPAVVVGRVAYDNWLVLNAIQKGEVVVDVSRTVLALHQTTKSGNSAGHHRPNVNYNSRMLRDRYRHVNFLKGATSCAPWITRKHQDGRHYVEESDSIWIRC